MLHVPNNSGSFAVSLVHKTVSLPSLWYLSRASLTSLSCCMWELPLFLLVQRVGMSPLTKSFPGHRVSAWQKHQNKGPGGYGRGQIAELWNFIKLGMFLYAKLLRGECCGCVVKLHRRLAEGWLKPGWWPVEQHCYKGLCIKWKKVVPSTVLFIFLLKTKLSLHFALFSWRGGWHLFYICGSSQSQLCRGGPGQRSPGLPASVVKSLGPEGNVDAKWDHQVQTTSTN